MTEAYDYVLGMVVPDEMLKCKYAQLKGSDITFADLIALSMTVIAASIGGDTPMPHPLSLQVLT